jgi:serine/threonine protein kinase
MNASVLMETDICSVETFEEHAEDLAPGTKLLGGQYTITNFLNNGGFGITYLAKNSLDRNVVIKECFPDSICKRSGLLVQPRSRTHQNAFSSVVKLFVREAGNQAKLPHPNIAKIHEVFSENNTAYMVIDYVDGADLLDVIEIQSGITPKDAEHWLRHSLKALGFVHDAGLLHRDISPDNILINHQNEPILIDFGAARAQAVNQDRVLSTLRVVKDGYSPYEFYVNGSPQTPASDLYGLGATFYHVLTGQTPPDSQLRLSALAQGQADTYVPLAGRFPAYPEAMLRAIDMALKVLPNERLQSAQQWLDMMDGKMHAPCPEDARRAKPVTPILKIKDRTEGRHNKGFITPATRLAAAIALTCIAIFGFGHNATGTPKSPPPAVATL